MNPPPAEADPIAASWHQRSGEEVLAQVKSAATGLMAAIPSIPT